MPKTAFIYTDEFLKFDYGPEHPLKISRLKLVYELIQSYGLLNLPDTQLIKARKATDEELLLFHKKEYLDILRMANSGIEMPHAFFYGVGSGDNPVFQGLLDWSRLMCGASLQAANLVESGKVDIAFNISGGLHHAMASKASGFCYINDIVIAIIYLLRKNKRIAYIDIDAHHGDGVQQAFYDSKKVLTVSIHETGEILFPGTGFEYETGTGEGEGYSVNIPMPPYSDDELFVYAFNEVVPPLIEKFKPDILVSQLGVDSFTSDPLAHLNYTNNGYSEVVRKIKEISPKWVALGGGGYDITNVAKAWTLAWAIMNDINLPNEIPEEYLKKYKKEGFMDNKLRDAKYVENSWRKEEMKAKIDKVIDYLKKNTILKGDN